jgi:hypothetical protein
MLWDKPTTKVNVLVVRKVHFWIFISATCPGEACRFISNWTPRQPGVVNLTSGLPSAGGVLNDRAQLLRGHLNSERLQARAISGNAASSLRFQGRVNMAGTRTNWRGRAEHEGVRT